MTPEELADYLRNHLSLSSETQPSSYGSAESVEVQLKLDNTVISTVWIDKCRCQGDCRN